MTKLTRMTVSALAVAILPLGLAAVTNATPTANDKSTRAEKVLVDKGLTRDDRKFLLADEEKTVIEKYKEAQEIRGAFETATKRYAAILDYDERVQTIGMQQQALQSEINSIQMELNSAPRSLNGRMRAMQNSAQAPYRQQQSQDRAALSQLNGQLQALKAQAPKAEERKTATAEYETQRKAYIASVRELDELVAPLLVKYHELGLDQEVQTALTDIRRATTQNVKLGPSTQVLAASKLIQEMKKMKVLTAKKPAARKKASSKTSR
jgi:hypothetical protein